MRVRLVIALALVASVLAVGRAGAEELSPAARSLAQCVQSNQRLSVLMLIDESGSLRTTDPGNQRVDGIKAALTGLADLAESPVNGKKPEVSVLMAGFYARARPAPTSAGAGSGAWKTVDRGTVDSLNATADDYAHLNQGRATDYGMALIAARQLLKDRLVEEGAEGQPPCEALIWFTDGRYSLPRRIGKAGLGLPRTVPYAPGVELEQPGAGDRAVAAGKKLMCKPGGLMDELADSGVIRFTVALSTQLAPADGQFLNAATTGGAGPRRCGTRLSPRSGQYLDARDSDRLFFAFGGLLSATPPVHADQVCPALACLRGQTRFSTVPGLSQFLIRAASGVDGSELELRAPGGHSVRLASDGREHASLADTRLTARWVSPTAVEVQGEFQPGGREWVGNWSYTFVDPEAKAGQPPSAKSHSSVQLFTDLEPVIVGDPSLIRGIPTKLAFELRDPALGSGGGLNSGPLLQSTSLTASIDDPVTETSTRIPVAGPDESGRFSATVTVPGHSSASFVYLSLTAHLAIRDGTPVAPQYRSYQVPVRFPPGQGFPLVSPSSLTPDAAQGTDGTEAELTIAGSPVAGGCIWLGAPDLRAPDAVAVDAEPEASSVDNCLHVGKGERRTVIVRFLPRSDQTGDVTGSLPVHLSSEIVPGERSISMPVSFAISTPPDATRRDVLLVVLVLFGALFPLLFLHLLNYLNARFTAPQDLLVLTQDAEAGPEGVSVSIAPEYAAFDPLTMVGESRKVRTLAIADLRFRAIATNGPTGLFRGPFGVVSAASGGLLAAGSLSKPLRSWRDGTEHEVPLSLAGSWFFVPSPAPSEEPSTAGGSGLWDEPLRATRLAPGSERVRGHLILVIANGGDTEMGEKLLADADRALRSDELRSELVERPQETEAEGEAHGAEEVGVAVDPDPPAADSKLEDDDPWA